MIEILILLSTGFVRPLGILNSFQHASSWALVCDVVSQHSNQNFKPDSLIVRSVLMHEIGTGKTHERSLQLHWCVICFYFLMWANSMNV